MINFLFLTSRTIKFCQRILSGNRLMRLMKIYAFFLLIPLVSCGDKDTSSNNTSEESECNWTNAADSSSYSLTNHFWNLQKYYFNNNSSSDITFNYWPQAHALDILVDAYSRTNNDEYIYYMNKWIEGVPVQNGNSFLNNYYDDMEWNALAMLRTFQATNDEQWLLNVNTIWSDIKTGWNSTMDGGIAWSKDQLYYKNTPANAPACILAARLYQLNGDESDKEWALKIYDWLKQHLYESGSGLVYDGINKSKTGVVDKSQYTYNQGTFVGAALELYKITGERTYLNEAVKAANYAISSEVNGNDYVLKDEGSGDGGLFKGIFIRYFTQLILTEDLSSTTRTKYIQFLKYNAQTLWQSGTNKQLVLFGTYWKTKPTIQTGLTEQMSGCMLLEAAALLKKLGYFDD
jgi:predicted alpha-1,6-mannanase (GH76 family)